MTVLALIASVRYSDLGPASNVSALALTVFC
jgi:hypothetical protein